MFIIHRFIYVIFITLMLTKAALAKEKVILLNVSYDPTRELYQSINKAFSQEWWKIHKQKVEIRQSHGGSGKQARSVIEGLPADIVSLATSYDIDLIAQKGLIDHSWNTKFPNDSSPYSSTIVFLVRKGCGTHIRDWGDLIKDNIVVVTPNPSTSGGARWNYLAAWAYATHKFDDDLNQAIEFMRKLYKNVPILEVSARSSTMSFIHRNIGDVLIAWENEALLIVNKLVKGQFDIVIPSITMQIDLPVTKVDKITKKHNNTQIAEAYLSFLYSNIVQNIIAENYYRPINNKILAKYKQYFHPIYAVTIDDLGGWDTVYNQHFANKGIFDQIYNP